MGITFTVKSKTEVVNKYHEKRFQYFNKYIDRYNQASEKSTPLIAFSSLSITKKELINMAENLFSEVSEFVSRMKNFTSTDDDSSKEILANSTEINKLILKIFNKSAFTDYSSFEIEQLQKSIENYCELTGKPFKASLYEHLNLTLKLQEKYNELSVQVDAIRMTIKHILDEDFPPKIEEFTETQYRDTVKKKGRSLDPTTPQKPIEEVVNFLLKKAIKEVDGFKKFIHESGKYKGNANYNQIKEYIIEETPELQGAISDRALLDRIKMAVPDDMK